MPPCVALTSLYARPRLMPPQGIPDLQSAAGIVEVEVVEANNVPKMDYFQKSSPYCK